MIHDRWAIVWDLFRAAVELPADRRPAFLASSSVASDIREEVMALLEASVACSVSLSKVSPKPATPEYAPGCEFGRYVIVGAVGEGGFGTIYAAHDRDLRRVVALKVFSGSMRAGVEPLIEEARAASALNHPNIVTIHETISIDGHLAIVMEFVDGRSLRQVLRDAAGPMPVATLVRYARQIAQALQAAHEAGIVHRDVKPENILVRKDEYIKLADFGLATDAHTAASPSSAGRLAGTLRYISPEQLRGEPGSPASDVFSLGLVMYEMAAGVHAFQSDTPLEAANAIATQQPLPVSRRVPKVPRTLDRLVAAMLLKNPAARPSAAGIASALEEIATRYGSKRKRAALWTAAAGAVALAILFNVWTRASHPMTLRLDSKPLTGASGRESIPAISPDGSSVVFAWQQKSGAPALTLVRDINSDRKVVLPITGPFAWTPDSRRIAFVRRGSPQDTLCTIAKDGSGAVQEVFRSPAIGDFVWSSNGELVVYLSPDPKTRAMSLLSYSTKTGQTRQLFAAPQNSQGPLRFALSADQTRLAVRLMMGHSNTDVYAVRLSDANSKQRLTFHEATGDAIAWVADGAAIISSTMRGPNYSLWLHPLASPATPTRLTEIGMDAIEVQAARDRQRLVWVNSIEDSNIWSLPLSGSEHPVRVVASPMSDLDIAVSPAGLLSFRSDRSGASEIWIAAADGDSPKKVTDLRGFTGSPAWSPDGHRIAFDSRRPNSATDIYLLDCNPAVIECAAPVQVTDHVGSDAIPSWSADGKFLYFASMRSGRWEVWKTAADGSRQNPVKITASGGFSATESPDQNWLYYSRIHSDEVMGIWRKRLKSPEPVDDPGEMILPLEFRATATWKLVNGEIFYAKSDEAGTGGIWVFNLKTRQKRRIYDAGNTTLARGLAVFPAGKSVLFATIDRSESNIMVADYEIVK